MTRSIVTVEGFRLTNWVFYFIKNMIAKFDSNVHFCKPGKKILKIQDFLKNIMVLVLSPAIILCKLSCNEKRIEATCFTKKSPAHMNCSIWEEWEAQGPVGRSWKNKVDRTLISQNHLVKVIYGSVFCLKIVIYFERWEDFLLNFFSFIFWLNLTYHNEFCHSCL